MKPHTRILAAVIMGIAVLAGCGSARRSSSGSASSTIARSRAASGANRSVSLQVPHYPGVPWFAGDSDGDNDRNADENMHTPGREGSPSERRAISDAVRRYYSTALVGNGRAACAMLARPLTTSMLVEYGRYGAPYLRGNTCTEIMSKVFRHDRRQVVAVASTQKLVDVRLEGDHGYAALHVDLPCLRGSCVLNERVLHIANVLVKREGDAWKIDSLLATV